MTSVSNQTPERSAQGVIDGKLRQAGWTVQSNKGIGFTAGPGIAVREY